MPLPSVVRCVAVFIALVAALVAQPLAAAPAELSRIATTAQFAALSRMSPGGRTASFPQLMFVIDRAGKGGPRLYFVNSRRFQFHIEFVQQTYLSTQSTDTLLKANYSKADRRFIFGSILHYTELDRYGVEFWDGDILDSALLSLTMDLIGRNFPVTPLFKPNSSQQEAVAATIAGLSLISANQLFGSRSELVLNSGTAIGRLRIIAKLDDSILLAPGDIVILGEAPLRLSPVAGIVTSEFSTPLAHVNLLAKSWKIPNGYVRDAVRQFAGLDGMWVRLDANQRMLVRPATPQEIARAQARPAGRRVQIAKADLSFRALAALPQLRARDAIRVGAKAANLGEVAARSTLTADGFSVPEGFAIPLAWYADYLTANGLDKLIASVLADPRIRSDGAYRRERLAAVRAAFDKGRLPEGFDELLRRRRTEVIGSGGLFVRSSTNSEDLPNFNGAGLYTTVPNVTDQAALENAVRTVWGSVWNDAAFAAREAAGIDHNSVRAAVLVQRGMNADASGVMITENPFDPQEPGVVFINAKRGLGIRVVEGRRVAEQLLYRADPEAIQVLTRSTDDAMLSFDAGGGVREIAVEPGRVVLTDERARRLARAGQRVASLFRGRPQDIEWLVIGDTIHIVQSRPYLRGN